LTLIIFFSIYIYIYILLDKNLTKYLSKIATDNLESSFDQEKDNWGYKKSSSIHIPGRIVLNIWRLMKAEFDIISYSIENIVNIIFNERYFNIFFLI